MDDIAASYEKNILFSIRQQFFSECDMFLKGLIYIYADFQYGDILLGIEMAKHSPGCMIDPSVVIYVDFRDFFSDLLC